MGINELIEKRNALLASAKAFLAEHGSEDGILSAEDAAEYDKMEAKIVDLGKEIDRRKRLEDIDNKAGGTLMRPPLTGAPENNGNVPVKPNRASMEYKNAMIEGIRSHFREVSNVLEGGVENGGYLVPDEFDDQIMEALYENNIMRKLAGKIKTTGEHKIPISGEDPKAAWLDEGEKMNLSNISFNQVILDAYKLGVAIPVPEELLQDSAYDIQQHVTKIMGRSLGNAEEDKFLNGDGTKGPTGIFDATNGGTQAVTVSGDITYNDVVKLVHSLKRPYRKNATFIMNDKAILDISMLKDGQGRPLWVESLVAGEPGKLMGYPVETTEQCPEGKIAFGDYHYYKIGDRGGRTISRYNELGALEGQVYFTGKERVDGKLTIKEAVQILTYNPTTRTSLSGSPVAVATVPSIGATTETDKTGETDETSKTGTTATTKAKK